MRRWASVLSRLLAQRPMAGGRHPIPIDRPMRQYRISRSGGRGDSAIGIGRRRRPTAQADGAGPTAQGRRRRPTAQADGSRPTELADGARRRSSPTELADGARRRQQPTEVADGACRRRFCTLDIRIRGCKCTTFAAQAVPVLDRVGLACARSTIRSLCKAGWYPPPPPPDLGYRKCWREGCSQVQYQGCRGSSRIGHKFAKEKMILMRSKDSGPQSGG